MKIQAGGNMPVVCVVSRLAAIRLPECVAVLFPSTPVFLGLSLSAVPSFSPPSSCVPVNQCPTAVTTSSLRFLWSLTGISPSPPAAATVLPDRSRFNFSLCVCVCVYVNSAQPPTIKEE